MKRIAILCAGRGSYTEAGLGSLAALVEHPWVRRAEELRAEYGLLSLVELDAAERFSASRHLRPANVSPLIWLITMLDAAAATAAEDRELVAVAGNSMGWYTALAVAGALDFDDGFRLVQEMALMQEEVHGGGQLIYPVTDGEWRPDPERAAAVEAALDSSRGEAFASIELGGYRVLAGSVSGMTHLMRTLPAVEPGEVGKPSYPFKLAQHGPYHSRLLADVAFKAKTKLSRLAWRAPHVTLVDGRGTRFVPWSTDLEALVDYTLGHQITRPFDFTRSVRVTLRELAPDRLVLPGPGNTLGGICGQILVQEGWRGVHSKAAFEALQAGPEPIVESLRR